MTSGFFVLRTPLLPFEELTHWSAGLKGPAVAAAVAADGDERLHDALAADRTLLRERLGHLLARPEILEALFIASPSLLEGMASWRERPDGERSLRFERALVRYISRMGGRATPFGLFAGYSLGREGPRSDLRLDGRDTHRRRSRVDTACLSALVDALTRDPDIRKQLLFRINSSLYRAGGRFRYAEARAAGAQRSYHLVALQVTDYLQRVIALAREGRTREALVRALVDLDDEIEAEDAESFIDELIDAQVLVPDLPLEMTGDEPIAALMAALRPHAGAADVVETLAEIGRSLAQMDAEGPGVPPRRYEAVGLLFEKLPGRVDRRRLFQVDLIKRSDGATLSPEPITEILRSIEFLRRQSGEFPDPFREFREAFMARYEGREMPLLEVLDEESGLGFQRSRDPGAEASPLIDALPFAAAGAERREWTPRHRFLLKKLEAAIRDGAMELGLEAGDLDAIGPAAAPPLPDAFSVNATLVSASPEALAAGEFRVILDTVSGPSGARFFGRFCHGDPALRELVERHLRAEESCAPEAAFAEIVHLPQGRLGNVVCRPSLRDYEIPFLGISGAPASRQIQVDDLLVSVQGGRVVLCSARLQREVMPRLTSAHNFVNGSHGIYRFLCMLQVQGRCGGLSWSWGPLQSLRFLPRVVTGRTVLSLARWSLDRAELPELGRHKGSARYAAVQAWRRRRSIPRYVEVADGDNLLTVDLDNVLSVESFVDLVKGRPATTLVEMYPGPEELCAHGPEGRFVHEIIVPFVRSQAPGPRTAPAPRLREAAPIETCFHPGSEWLYARIYAGQPSVDQILKEVTGPIARQGLEAGAIDRWFFLRYADPEHHLRVRFHGSPSRLVSEVLPSLHEALSLFVRDGRVSRLTLDTYVREVRRYGGSRGMLLSEELFHADSEAVLDLLDRIEGDEGASLRWRIALVGMDRLLDDFGFDQEAKRDLARRARISLAGDMKLGKGFFISVGARYRRERSSVESWLDPTASGPPPQPEILEIMRRRSERLLPVRRGLAALSDAGILSLSDLVTSYLHMFVNRLMRSATRQHEVVLYDFLERTYESMAARRRPRVAVVMATAAGAADPGP